MENAQQIFVPVIGFGDKDHGPFATALEREFPGSRICPIQGCPEKMAHKHPRELSSIAAARIADIKKETRGDLYLLGHSYGGSIAFGATVESDFEGIAKTICIDAPLNPDVRVSPPTGMFCEFAAQYEHREAMMREWISRLPDGKRPGILTIGSSQDRIVPPAAKSIPGILHVTLPERFMGHSLGPKINEIIKWARRFIDGSSMAVSIP